MLRRVFFAISLSQKTRRSLHEHVAQYHIEDHTHALRWTKPHDLHVTLRFIAALHDTQLSLLIHKVEQQLRHEKPFTLTFMNLHFFPNKEKPKVLAMHAGPQNVLLRLSQIIADAMDNCGLHKDDREFAAHLTLARFRHRDLPVLEKLPLTPSLHHRVHEVTLFESRPSEHGSQYLPLHTFILRGA